MTKPSTWGCTVVERRDFTVPTNSVVCSTGRSARVTTSTGMAGAPPGGPAWLAAAAGRDARTKGRQARPHAGARRFDRSDGALTPEVMKKRGAARSQTARISSTPEVIPTMSSAFEPLFAAALVLAASSSPPAAPQSPPPAAEVTTQLPRTVRPTHYDDRGDAGRGRARPSTGKVVISLDVLRADRGDHAERARHRRSRRRGSPAARAARRSRRRRSRSTPPRRRRRSPSRSRSRAAPYRLALDYTGKIGTQAVGLFAHRLRHAGGQASARCSRSSRTPTRAA